VSEIFEKPPISFSHSVEQLHNFNAYPLKYSSIYLHKNIIFYQILILPSKDISVPGTVRNMPAEDPSWWQGGDNPYELQ
jgi:hypothetical protein